MKTIPERHDMTVVGAIHSFTSCVILLFGGKTARALDRCLGHNRWLLREVERLEKRVAELEAPPEPPVVPPGWWVDRWTHGDNGPEVSDTDGLWRLTKAADEEALPVADESEDDTDGCLLNLMQCEGVPAAAVAALLAAIRTGKRPTHAGDPARVAASAERATEY